MAVPGRAHGVAMTAFDFRVQLLRLSHKLKDEDKEQDTELDVMKSFFKTKMSADVYNKITKGYELFAYLEDKELISQDNLQALVTPLGVCGRTLECLFNEGRSERTAEGCSLELRSDVLANLDMEVYSARDTSKVEGLYRQCLCRVGNGIATSDGSLAELVYLCPELSLSLVRTMSSPSKLFCYLEHQGLISCWKLSYLYCRLSALGRRDLCKEVEQYSDTARLHMPRITPSAERRRSKHYVRSRSEPESKGGSVSTMMKSNVSSSLPASFLRRQSNIPQQDSITEQDEDTPRDDMSKQLSEKGGTRGNGEEDCDSPFADKKPDSNKPVSRQGGVVDTQDKSGLWQRVQEDKRHLPHPSASSNAAVDGTTPDITFFNHKVYRCLRNVLLWNVSYGLFCAVLVLVAAMALVKFLVEFSACGCGTAVLNLLGRGMTHLCFPTIILHIMVKIAEDNRVGKMRILSCSRESEPIFESVIQKLSSHKEVEHLRRLPSVAERINFLLNSKLSVIMSAALLQSTAFLAQVMILGAANYPHFTGIASHVAAVSTTVMVIGAFIIHLVTGVAVCLYLFEMRVREYLAYIEHVARKQHVSTVAAAAEEARETILQRWSTFQRVMTFLSVVHTLLLVYSIWSSTPFRCYGDSVKFNETELKQVPISWLLWIVISLICHTCVYNYYSFTAWRITAVLLQMFSMLLCILDHSSPKWGLMIQISNVVYPCASLFWICVLACHNVYLKAQFSLDGAVSCQRLQSAVLWGTLVTHARFLFYACLALAILCSVPTALYNEYNLLTEGAHSE